MLAVRGGVFFNNLHQPTYRQLAASLRSGFKSRLNGLLALLMRTTNGERRGQLQYFRQYHQHRNHRYYRYNQEEEAEEES